MEPSNTPSLKDKSFELLNKKRDAESEEKFVEYALSKISQNKKKKTLGGGAS